MKYTISKGIKKRAVRICMYAVEGCGKTTWASQFPDPLFIDTEDGSFELDVNRFPKPETWADLLGMVDAVIAGDAECKTLVIDTADRAEELLTKALLSESGKSSIEDFGYGKGYVMVAERFTKDLLNRLDRVIAKGINVIITAHAVMRKVESPEDPPYDHWELSLSRKVGPKIKEWTDILLFANYEITVVEDNGRNKAKGKAKRVMFANHSATYDAKNRFNLPDKMPLSFEPMKKIIEGTSKPQKERNKLEIDTPVTEPVDTTLEDVRDVLLRRLSDQGIDQLRLEAWCVATGRLAPGSGYMDLSGTQAEGMLKNIDILIKELKKGEANK